MGSKTANNGNDGQRQNACTGIRRLLARAECWLQIQDTAVSLCTGAQGLISTQQDKGSLIHSRGMPCTAALGQECLTQDPPPIFSGPVEGTSLIYPAQQHMYTLVIYSVGQYTSRPPIAHVCWQQLPPYVSPAPTCAAVIRASLQQNLPIPSNAPNN